MEQRKNIISIGANDFVKGIGLSSREGMQLVQDVDPFNIDGTLQAGFKTVNTFPDILDATFTVNTTTDELTLSATTQYTREGTTYTGTGRAITVFVSPGTLPAPLVAGTVYFVIQVSQFVIKLATTYANALAGSAIDITTSGGGTLQIFDLRQEVIIHYALDDRAGATDSIYGQDPNGRIWNYNSATGWHLVFGNNPDALFTYANGLAIWNGYLFSFNSITVDIMILSSGVWHNGWKTASDGLSIGNYPSNNSHTAFVAKNNILYFANAGGSSGFPIPGSEVPLVGSLQQVPGTIFLFSDAGTYTWNSNALDLPPNEYITDFEELDLTLEIGTIANSIYPWDTESPSFGTAIPTKEQNVTSLKVINNMLYYACGFRGNMYRTLGTTSEQVLNFSDQVSNVPQIQTIINDIEQYQGYILFSISGATPGLYLMDIENNGRYHLKNICSSVGGIPGAIFSSFNQGLYGSTAGTAANYIYYRYMFSFSDTFTFTSTVRGCDSNFMLKSGQWRQTDDKAFFYSQLYRVADNQLPYTFDQVNLYLTEPIQSDHKVIIQYRTDNQTAFSSAKQTTFDFNAMASGGGVAGNASINIENARMFQVKVIISIPANISGTSQYVTPKIAEITFK